MPFISYAQNFEDVMLFRSLKGVEKGVYIDVGAHDPIGDSVTKAFYERGWRGINIEPIEKFFNRLVEDRPDDINVKTVVLAKEGETIFYEVKDTGLNTISKNYAQKHEKQGYVIREHLVSCTTLDKICEQNEIKEVHFLKIDVEGAEREVLEGFSFSSIRPWIVLVEATELNSSMDSSGDWEGILLGKDYRFVYFDGINRFYISNEKAELEKAFKTPPNFFDDFIKFSHWRALQKAKILGNLKYSIGRKIIRPFRYIRRRLLNYLRR